MAKAKIYTAPKCPYCDAAKEFFRKHKVSFEEVDVSKSPQAANHMVEISKQKGVPVIVIDKKVIVGFDVERIKDALKIEDKKED